ncbi:MAG TPA: type II secretion system protein GspK [Candidatus Omnitrophota bacterium]|nr:type II secretion system protein GspK [Candidatus Omnitrophota bacterium]
MSGQQKNKKGSILILTVWVLIFLTTFAVHMGIKARQRIILLSRVENRSQLHYIAQAAMNKAAVAIRKDYEKNRQGYSIYSKYYRHHNPSIFSSIRLGHGRGEVSYFYYEKANATPEIYYGVVDEEGKLNINFASREELNRLMEKIPFIGRQKGALVVEAILSWRDLGETQLQGFYSDNYYEFLEYPYSPKHYFFEYPDELLLLQGMTVKFFEQLSRYVTVYGDGRVNINTASREVLYALGLEDAVIEKFLFVRRGVDGRDFTLDDYIFEKTHDIASDMAQLVEVKEIEAKQIDTLNKTNKVKINSAYYFIRTVAKLNNQKDPLVALGVFNTADCQWEYYKEGR